MMGAIPFVCWWLAAMLVIFIIIALIFGWLDRRRDQRRLGELIWILKAEKQKRDKKLRDES